MKRRKQRRGTLSTIAGLLIASAIIRVGTEAGPAFANNEDLAAATPTAMSEERHDTSVLLAALQEREKTLNGREVRLRDRMRVLREAEGRLDEKLASLIAAEEVLSATIAMADSAAETDLGRLTTVYENMKPKEAAALFAEMSPQFAAGFLGLMRPEAAALIMSQLAPETAYSFSVVLAGRNANVPTQ